MSSGRRWEEADVALLKRMDDRRICLDEMAARLKRPKRAVEVKLYFVRMGPVAYAKYIEKNRLAQTRRRTGVQAPKSSARHALSKFDTWHGRCPAFRPLGTEDANRSTRL